MGRLWGRFRLMQAKRRYMPTPVTSSAGAAALVIALLVAAIIAVTVVERKSAVRERSMVEYAAARRADPTALLGQAARSRPLVLIGDVGGASAPKRLAADLIGVLSRGPGLDYVAIEVGTDLQPWIDQYIDSRTEDASFLLGHPRTVHGAEGSTSDFLSIYRRVRELNGELAMDRRIRVIAIDSPEWPPGPAASPARILSLIVQRDEHMLRVIEERVLRRDRQARILLFVDGLRVLRARARFQSGGAMPAQVPLLAARLDTLLPGRVVSVLVDASAAAGGSARLPGYRAAGLDRILRPAAESETLAFPIEPSFAATLDDIGFAVPPGIKLDLEPAGVPLAEVADFYVRLSN